ncbi:MAG: DUF5666 domain-containing protein [Desulfobacteria bacterium]
MKNRPCAASLLGILTLGSILAMSSCWWPTVDLSGWGNGDNVVGTGVGPVSGFGSVIVNGVKYDDAGIDNASFFDDHGRTEADLAAGMMIKITAKGVGNSSGTGTATKIEVLPHVDGPLDDNGVTLTTNRMTVMGQTVVVDTTTVFDNAAVGGLVDLAAIDNLAKAGKRPELEIHGIADNTGTIHATFIHEWSDNVVAGRDVQVKGIAANYNFAGKTFTLGTSTVSFATRPAGLGNGVFVEVKGTFRTSDNTVLATTITVEDPTAGQGAGDRPKVEGYVNRMIALGAQFELVAADGLQTVNWSAGTTFKDGSTADLVAGARVVVEGKRNPDKTLESAVISFRKPSNIRMDTTVTVPTLPPNALTLFGKTVFVNSLTQYLDSRDGLRTFGLANIVTGDTLRVSAFQDNSTVPERIVASRVERIDAFPANDRNILQGRVQSQSMGAFLTILGITLQASSGTTEFLQADGTLFPGVTSSYRQMNFFAAVVEGQTVVRARGTAGSSSALMTANEVQIRPAIDN